MLALGGLAVAWVVLVRRVPEAFLGLLLVAGPLESTTFGDRVASRLTAVAHVETSLTAIALLGVLTSAGYHGWRRRNAAFQAPQSAIAFVLLMAMLLAASFHSPDPAGAFAKAMKFESITALGFFAPLLIIDGRRSLVRFAAAVAGIGFTIALFATQTGHASHPLTLPGSDSEIVVGEYAGLGLIAIVAILWPLTPGLWRLLWAPPAAIMLNALVGAGSRGALLATTMAIVVALAFLLKHGKTRGPALAVVLAIGIAAPIIWATSPPAARAKYLATVSVDQASQALNAGGGERQEIVSAGVALFRENPLGVGTAGYTKLTGFVWPHNIIVELGAELGVVGIVLFLLIIAGVVARVAAPIRRGSTETLGAAVLALALLALSFSSFDLNGNRSMWLLLGVALAAGAQGAAPPRRAAR